MCPENIYSAKYFAGSKGDS